MIWSMQLSSQAAFLRLPRRLVWVHRSRATKLRAILRRRAKLRAAVRSRTRLSSSRKVTSSTQCSAFSNTPMPADRPDQDSGIIVAACQEVADLGLDPAGAVDAPDR